MREEATRREQKARLDAEAANRAKDEFIAMISHELRTPLGAILIWAQLLRAEELDASATARAVGMIERSTKTLAQLIDDLLDVSRIIAGKLTFEARPVDLRFVVEAALDAAQPAAQSKGVTIERMIEAGVPPISGDAGRLQQVVGNLLANAIKFTPEGGRVEAALERSGGRARIRVRDTGSGIRAEFLPFIFERFRQADTTSTRKQKGLGLGLAIARHIVEMHGGSIEAASAGEGEGSTFTVTVPARPARRGGGGSGPLAGRRRGARRRPRLSGVRILVVDDEEDAREAMVVLLSQAGAAVQSVGSAAEAMDAAARAAAGRAAERHRDAGRGRIRAHPPGARAGGGSRRPHPGRGADRLRDPRRPPQGAARRVQRAHPQAGGSARGSSPPWPAWSAALSLLARATGSASAGDRSAAPPASASPATAATRTATGLTAGRVGATPAGEIPGDGEPVITMTPPGGATWGTGRPCGGSAPAGS